MKTTTNFEYTCYFTNACNLDILEKFDDVIELSFNIDWNHGNIYFFAECEGVNIEISANKYGCELDLFYVKCLKDAYALIQPDHIDTFDIINELVLYLNHDFKDSWDEYYQENNLDERVYELTPFDTFEFTDLFDDKIKELVSGIR